MVSKKITSIGVDYENQVLKQENDVFRSVIEYSVVEKLQHLKDENGALKNEIIAVKSKLEASDNLIKSKDEMIRLLKEDIDNRAEIRVYEKFKEQIADYERQLKNAKSNGGKRVRTENNLLKQHNDELKTRHESLLAEFNVVNSKLDEQSVKLDNLTNITKEQTNLITSILEIVNNSDSIEEAQKVINETIVESGVALGIEYKNNRKPTKQEKEAFARLVYKLKCKDMTNIVIGNKLFNEGHPMMKTVSTEKSREQKVRTYLQIYERDYKDK